jgi:hypothetical protein
MGERSDETVGHMVTRQHFTVSDSHELLTQHVFERCPGSMRRRCQACINANGGYTRY